MYNMYKKLDNLLNSQQLYLPSLSVCVFGWHQHYCIT